MALEVRPCDLSDEGIARTCELLRAVFPHATHIDVEYLKRLYRGNPMGPTSGVSGWEGDDLVGHYLMIPIVVEIFGKAERGIWPFQLATHPDYQGKGVFSTLAEASFEQCRRDGYGFLSGVGNEKSSPIFVKRWGFQAIRPLDVKLGLGTVAPRGELPGCQFRQVWERDAVRWRLGLPAVPYRVRRRDGIAHLYADTGRYGIDIEVGAFPEEWIPADQPTRRGLQPLRMWAGIDPARDWSGTLYFDVPERLKPSPLIFLFWDLTDAGREFDPDKVQYELFNFDAY